MLVVCISFGVLRGFSGNLEKTRVKEGISLRDVDHECIFDVIQPTRMQHDALFEEEIRGRGSQRADNSFVEGTSIPGERKKIEQTQVDVEVKDKFIHEIIGRQILREDSSGEHL